MAQILAYIEPSHKNLWKSLRTDKQRIWKFACQYVNLLRSQPSADSAACNIVYKTHICEQTTPEVTIIMLHHVFTN